MDNIVLDQKQIAAILPQSYPFIMIDRVIDYKKGESLVATKNITGNEWVFEAPSYKTNIFPETLIIEAASQAALIFYYLNRQEEGKEILSKIRLGGIKAEFIKIVSVSDQINLITRDFKLLGKSGYININVSRNNECISKIKVFYGLSNNLRA